MNNEFPYVFHYQEISMNILLVDDDRFVLTSLEQNMDWNRLGFKNIFTANNISQAKNIICQNQIHILITDIDMPQGSGLDLLTWIRSENYDMQTIILTNYADFSYAQKAIELQSLEYYLKPISFDSLYLIIKKAIDKVKSVQQSKIDASIANNWEDAKANIYQHFWNDYLKHGENYTKQYLLTKIQKNHLPYKSNDYFIIMLFDLFPYTISEDNEIVSHFAHDKKLFLRFESIFRAMFVDIISPFDMLLESTQNKAQFIALLGCTDADINDLQLKLKYTCDKLILTARQQHNSSLSCYIGVPCNFDDFHVALKRLQVMNSDIIDCRNQVFTLDNYTPVLSEYEVPNLEVLDKYLRTGNHSLFIDACRDYLITLSKSNKLNFKVITNFLIDITQLVYSFLKENGVFAHRLLQGSTNELLLENSTKSIEDMLMYITFLINTSINYVRFSASQKSVASIICDYIDAHYAEDINRNNLGEIVYLDPDYAARLFKKEKGISLVNYIIQKRVSVAKELLKNSELPVNLISDKVGYGNYSYFTKLFKKETNYTPIDYRRIAK
jgi:two-component system, response regulator YesN